MNEEKMTAEVVQAADEEVKLYQAGPFEEEV